MVIKGMPLDGKFQRAVFLDRDGVINKTIIEGGRPYAPTTLDSFEIISNTVEALLRLRNAGYLNIVITNQPDIKSGKQLPHVLLRMHELLMRELALDDILVCPHDDDDECFCRKPKPGMLLKGAEKYPISLRSSWLIGDRWRDIEAGQTAGCRCIFIDYEYTERQPVQPFVRAANLSEAVDIILRSN